MGILNVTPDSFYSGSRVADVDKAIERGLNLYGDGAAIIDIGGESSRPGADPVDTLQEQARIIPVIEGLKASSEAPVISVDTYHPETAVKAIEAGADIINDISGFRDARMVAVAAETGVGVVVMHMLGEPRTMQRSPDYSDVV